MEADSVAMGEQLDLFDLERIAGDIRARARLRDDEILPSETIARRVLGRSSVQRVSRLSATGFLLPVNGVYRIFVRREAQDQNFIVAHELGHWGLRAAGYAGGDEERNADYIGAAIVASPGAVRRAYRHFEENLPAIAMAFDATQSLIVLRLAEVLRQDRALVTREAVRVRGFGDFAWPEAGEVRQWATARAPRGVVKARLRGSYDSGRVALSVTR